jgi:diguanylate cyclase (GGDEF)-like protein
MTNLYKKHYFRNLIEKIISKSSDDDIFAMMFIDIDDFKSINDNYGHDIGDEVIINIAQRIIQSLSYSDIACRFGGDEFVVWLQGTKEKETEVIADRILKNIMKPITVEEFEISISVSIGISIYGSAINSFDAMIVESDRRMYLAKADGKNRYKIED